MDTNIDFEQELHDAVEIAADGAVPLALLPNDLGLDDGRMSWDITEQCELRRAIAVVFPEADLSDPGSQTILVGIHPLFEVAVYAQTSQDGDLVYYLDSPP